MDNRTPRAAAYALQDTANLGLFAPPPISRPVRKLTSFKHTPGPAAMLTKSPKFTYRLAGHTLPLGAVLLRRKYKCGRFSTFAGRFFPTNRKNFRLSSIDLAISPGWPTMLRQTVGEFCPLWEYSDSHGSMFDRRASRYAPCKAYPSQIRTCGFPASGSPCD